VQVLFETLVVGHLVKTFFTFLVCQGRMPCFSRRYSLRFHLAHKAGCITVTKYRGMRVLKDYICILQLLWRHSCFWIYWT